VWSFKRLIAAAVDEITAKYRGCVKGKADEVALGHWTTVEGGKRTAHSAILTPENEP
jgi:hypothetical protein